MTMTTEKEIRDFYRIPQGADRFIKQQLEAHKRNANTPPLLEPTPHFVSPPAAAKPAPQNKSVVPVGNKVERTPEGKKERHKQALATLQAFLNEPAGFTDRELAVRRIGGSDGARRRRECRQKLGISFNVKSDPETKCSRWSLADPDRARRVLKAGCAVEEL
jgi:hypothetical protein